MTAFGNTRRALSAKESGAGAPPKRSDSMGYPAKELSVRSETIDGTL